MEEPARLGDMNHRVLELLGAAQSGRHRYPVDPPRTMGSGMPGRRLGRSSPRPDESNGQGWRD